jgi:hypothetical protein
MNPRRLLFLCGLFITAIVAGGCESCETPTVPVMPDPRLKPAALMPDDFGTVPKMVEVKVPVPSPQLRRASTLDESSANRVGGGLSAPVLPHHRTYSPYPAVSFNGSTERIS